MLLFWVETGGKDRALAMLMGHNVNIQQLYSIEIFTNLILNLMHYLCNIMKWTKPSTAKTQLNHPKTSVFAVTVPEVLSFS